MQPPRVIAQFIKRSRTQVLALKATFNFRKSEKLKAESYSNKFISMDLRPHLFLLLTSWRISCSAWINNPVPGEVFPVGVPLFKRWAAADCLVLAETHELIHAALHLLPSVPDPHHAVPTGALPMGHVSVLQRKAQRWLNPRRRNIFFSFFSLFYHYQTVRRTTLKTTIMDPY